MAGILDFIDQKLGTRFGLLMSDPRAAIEQMNQQAGAYNQASLLATQAERNALRGLPVTPEQAAAKQYVDKTLEDVAGGFAGTTIGKNAIAAAKETLNKPRMGVWQGEKPLDMWKAEQQARIEAEMQGKGKQKFLEESKVKDRLYHATAKDFTEFKPGGDNPNRSGSAIWMTPNKEFQPAAHNIRQIPDRPGYMYGSSSNMFTPGTNVMPLYANIKNPLIVTESNWQKMFEGTGGDPWVMPQQTVDILKKRGHDGVFYYNKNGTLEEVVAFDPTQVKSAIGNIGTYDITNPNILAAGVPVGLLAGTNVEMPKKQEKKSMTPKR